MSKRPPKNKTKMSVSYPEGSSGQFMQHFGQMLERAAENCSSLNIEFNYFPNAQKVTISKKDSSDTTLLEGAEIMNEEKTEKTEIHANQSVVNYKSRLDNVTIMLEATISESTSDTEKDVHDALKEFSNKLKEAQEGHAEEVELLSQRLEELTQQVAKPSDQRKPRLLTVSAQGLKDAVTAIGNIVPGLIETANTIAE